MNGLGSLLCENVASRVIDHLNKSDIVHQQLQACKALLHSFEHCLSCDIPYNQVDCPIRCKHGEIVSCGRSWCIPPTCQCGRTTPCLSDECDSPIYGCFENTCKTYTCPDCDELDYCNSCGRDFCDLHIFQSLWHGQFCRDCIYLVNLHEEYEDLSIVGGFYFWRPNVPRRKRINKIR